MTKFLRIALLTGLLVSAAPNAAHATHADYRGGCSFTAANDATPDGQLGGQSLHNGEVQLLAIASDSSANKVPTGASITVSCELKINGVSQGTVLGPTSGTGAVADAGQIQYSAAESDVVTLCDHVTVDGESLVRCDDATSTEVVPPPVFDAFDSVYDSAGSGLLCSLSRAIAGVVNSLHTSVYINPADGDVWYDSFRVMDCPPYGNRRPRPHIHHV